jgi:hypothetical protein
VESPGSWRRAEAIIDAAQTQYRIDTATGMVGLSAAARVAQALRRAGLLHDEDEPELGFDGLRAFREELHQAWSAPGSASPAPWRPGRA